MKIARRIFPGIKSISGHNLKEATQHIPDETFRYMTVLRDPVKRCISHFQDNCLRHDNKLPFEEWIKNERIHNLQVKHIAGEDNLEKAKKLLQKKYFFIGLTERFDESLQLLKIISPYKLNINYKKKVVAKDNSIKNEIMKNPDKLALAKKHNQLDVESYNWVTNELFPGMIEKKADEIKQTAKPEEKYKTVLTWNYQMSIFYNKFIYKIILKLMKERN